MFLAITGGLLILFCLFSLAGLFTHAVIKFRKSMGRANGS